MEDNKDLDLGEFLEKKIQENIDNVDTGKYEVSDERLKEMNKKLPSWSLEPPFSFLK